MRQRPEKRLEKNAALPGVRAISSTPRGVLVEPVDEARARLVTFDIGIEQAVDVLRGPVPPWVARPGGLLSTSAASVLRSSIAAARARSSALSSGRVRGGLAEVPARRHAQDLAGGEAVLGFRAPAVDPHLPGARPARHGREADLGQVALEPAVEADAVVVGLDGELPDRCLIGRGHPASRIAIARGRAR